jgi:phospholipid/cholesterol/gamma-HCH transport system substrate-binding protein
MERNAPYALVGALTILILAAAMIFVAWLGKAGFARDFDPYRVVFEGPIHGLSNGSEVQFNGIRVGEVERIRLDSRNPKQVAIDVKVKAGTPIRIDSFAVSEPFGISGYSIVQIDAGSPNAPLLRDASRDRRPVIRGRRGSLAVLMQSGSQLVFKANEALDRINRVLSDRTIGDLGSAVHNVKITSDEIAANRAMFRNAGSALAKLDVAASDVQHTARSIRTLADGDGRRTLADLQAAASEMKLAIRDARGTIARLDAHSETIGETTIPELNQTMQSIRRSADALDGLLRDVRRDPRGTLGKPRARELEVQP